jgi:hypothetical protein
MAFIVFVWVAGDVILGYRLRSFKAAVLWRAGLELRRVTSHSSDVPTNGGRTLELPR